MNLKSLTPLPTKIHDGIYGVPFLNGMVLGLKFGLTRHYNTAGLAGWRISSAFTGFCPVWWFLNHVMRENRDTECGNPFPSAKLTPRTVAMMASLLGCLLQPNISAGTSPSNWPQFRGPNGSGLAPDDKPAPVVFGPNKNELWHTSLLSGHSSPCIWGQRIFLTCFDETHQRVETVCLDRSSGRILWKVAAPEMVLEKGLHAFSSHASSTPATDGQRIYVYIGAYGVVAYDFDGKTVWTRSLPTPPTQYGTASSPIVHDGLVLLQRDGRSTNSQILALNSKSGQTTWTANRPLHRESFSTPMIWEQGQVAELVTVGNGRLDAYDARTGKERWWTPGLTFQPISVAVAGDGLIFASSSGTGSESEPASIPDWAGLLMLLDKNGDGQLSKDEVPKEAAVQLRKEVSKETPGNMLTYQMLLFEFFDANRDGIFSKEEAAGLEQFSVKNRNNLMAIRPGGSGNISASHVQWQGSVGISEMPSPLYYRGRIYFVKDGGLMTSYDPKTGKRVHDRERLGAGGQFTASPVASGGNVYAASMAGKVAVFRASDRLEVVSLNDLGETISATPAVLEGKLYIRTAKHLWAFGE